MPARAWVDWSGCKDKSILDLESNDMTYTEKLIMVPEHVSELLAHTIVFDDIMARFSDSLVVYNKNIELHLSVLQEMRDTLRALRKEKEARK
jgi:hypothetical protein